ncbi:MAG: hypothetical protein ACK559_29040, partial [bacterium]
MGSLVRRGGGRGLGGGVAHLREEERDRGLDDQVVLHLERRGVDGLDVDQRPGLEAGGDGVAEDDAQPAAEVRGRVGLDLGGHGIVFLLCGGVE